MIPLVAGICLGLGLAAILARPERHGNGPDHDFLHRRMAAVRARIGTWCLIFSLALLVILLLSAVRYADDSLQRQRDRDRCIVERFCT